MANDTTSIESNSELQKISQVIGSGFNGSWEEKWQQGLTPWDLGKPTPIIEHLHQAGALPNGRTLIPGCGRGYDVVAIACLERFFVGLDISDSAIKKAKEVFLCNRTRHETGMGQPNATIVETRWRALDTDVSDDCYCSFPFLSSLLSLTILLLK